MKELTKPRNNPQLRRIIKERNLISLGDVARNSNKSIGCIRHRTERWNIQPVKHSATLFINRVDGEFLKYSHLMPDNRISLEAAEKIIELYREDMNMSRYAIAECCNVHLSTTYRIIADYIESGALIMPSRLNYVID